MVNRRKFIQDLGALGIGAAGLGAFADMQRIAAAAGLDSAPLAAGEDYRALVILFMFGGNDANNMVIPTTASEYAAYASGRTSVLALPTQQILPISVANTPGRTFGVHPAMSLES